MTAAIDYSPRQFTLFRVAFGLYLLCFTGLLVPHAANLLSAEGMVTDPRVNITYGYFPSPLLLIDSPVFVTLWMALASAASAGIMLGYRRKVCAVIVWFCLASAFNRNNQLWSPALPLVGWMLLALAIIPEGEPLSISGKSRSGRWQMPPVIFWGAWIVLGVSYSVSGFVKAAGPSWIDGTAIRQTLEWTWARDWWLNDFFLDGPHWITTALTYGTLALELFYAPCSLSRILRPVVWAAMVLMHLNILMLIDIVDLTTGVLLIHLFTFDSRWIKRRNRA